MFKRIIASPRWYGFNFLIPSAGLPIGSYPTGIIIPKGANFVWIRQNVMTLVGNSPASAIGYGDGTNPTAFGAETEPQFSVGNLFAQPYTFNFTQIFIDVIGDSLVSGEMNYTVMVIESH